MARARKKAKKKATTTAPTSSLPLKNFDLQKRYDVYYHLRRGLTVCKDVQIKGKRTFEEIGDAARPFVQYLELEDPKGRTFMLNYLHVFMICEAGVKARFTAVKS